MSTEWIIGLAVSGLLLVLTEIIVPGMVIGIIGTILIIAALVLAFVKGGVVFGFGLLLGVLLAGGILFWLWVTYFPRTGMGKRMILQKDGRDWHGYDKKYALLLGKPGVALSMLRPAGIATIEGNRVDVVTRGEMIDAGNPVEVIEIEGNRIVVAAPRKP